MNAWRVIEDHRPIGSINRARLFAMMNSQNQRLSLNNVVEPVTGRKTPGFQFWTPDELGINQNFVPPRIKDGFPGNPLPYNPLPPTTPVQPPKGAANTLVGVTVMLLALLAFLL